MPTINPDFAAGKSHPVPQCCRIDLSFVHRITNPAKKGPGEPMRIAQIAPLHEAVPPKLYGGTERVVSFLTEELVAMGHDVTLFASGDSVTRAKLIPVWPQALRLDPTIRDAMAPQMLLMEEVYRRAHEF